MLVVDQVWPLAAHARVRGVDCCVPRKEGHRATHLSWWYTFYAKWPGHVDVLAKNRARVCGLGYTGCALSAAVAA